MQQPGRLCAYCLVMGVVGFASCSDKITQSTPVSFSFKVEVSDTNGNPVSGLRVDAFNLLSTGPRPLLLPALPEPTGAIPVPTEFRLSAPYPNPFVGSMSTEFDLPVACSYEFRVTDLADREVFFFSDSSVDAGTYTPGLGPSVSRHTAYVIQVVAFDSSRVLFVDTTFVSNWSPDPAENTLGQTDGNGELLTHDSLCFPSLFGVPEMDRTEPPGTVVGRFHYVDSVWIVLSDSNGLQQDFVQPLYWGKNVTELVWQQ
jgi:hypothetical protein